VHKDTCEWRYGGLAPKGLNCHDDELVAGLSSGSSLNVYCCYSGRTNERCSPIPYWIKQSSTACLPDTAVAAVCSYNCDPTGAIDATDTRANVSVMTFCQGTFFTNVYTRRLTQCSTGFVSCRDDEMMLGVHPCTSPPGSVRVTCADVRYSAVIPEQPNNGCVNVSGNGNVWCPDGYVATGACAPNMNGTCFNGSDTQLRCCRVRQFYQGGIPCKVDTVYTTLGGMRARSVPFGLDEDSPAAFAVKRFEGTVGGEDDCRPCLFVYSVAISNDASTIYALIGGTGDSSLGITPGGFVVRFSVGGISPVTEHVAGNPRVKGFSAYDDTSAKRWTRRKDMLMDFTLMGSIAYAGTQTPPQVLVSEGNFIRRMDANLDGEWKAEVFAGDPSSTLPFVNNTPHAQATFRNKIEHMLYSDAWGELYVATQYMIVILRAAMMSYYAGDGTELPTTDSYPTGNNKFRTQQQIGWVQSMVIEDEAVLYFADRSTENALIAVDMHTGIIKSLGVNLGFKPIYIALYKPLDKNLGKQLFVVREDGQQIYKVSLVDRTVIRWSGTLDQRDQREGDRVIASDAAYIGIRHIIATRNQLVITDMQHGAIRIGILDPCSIEFNSTDLCRTCNQGYYHYPRCRDICTLEDDCLARATSVTGWQPENCTCVCVFPFRGPLCRDCAPQFDKRYGCLTCAPGYYGRYPHCRTLTNTLSITRRRTISASLGPPTVTGTSTISLSLPPTKTLPRTITHSLPRTRTPTKEKPPSTSPTRSVTLSLERVILPTDTGSMSFSGNTQTISTSPVITLSVPLLPTKSISDSLITRTPTLTVANWTNPVPTKTVTRTRSASSTLALTATRTQPRTTAAPPTTTRPPPANTTPSPPKPTTTAAPPTPARTLPPGTMATRPPKVTAVPGAPEIPIWGEVTGRVTVPALRSGAPVEERTLTIEVKNAFFDVEKCQQPNQLLFDRPSARAGDTSFVTSNTVWCNFTHMTVAFSISPLVNIGDDVQVGIWLHQTMMYNQSVYVRFTVAAPPISKGVEDAQTAAAAATVAISVVGGGAGGATEIQGLGVLGLMSCAEPEIKGAMRGARKAMAPWQLGNDEIGLLLGNLVIVLCAVAFLGLVTGGLYLKFRYDESSGKKCEEDEYPDPTEPLSDKEPLMRAMILVGAPGLIFTVMVLTHQGIALEAHMLLHDPEVAVGSKVFGAFGALYALSIPILLCVGIKKKFRGVMGTYRYVHEGVPLPLRIVMPSQFWLPINYANMNGTIFKTLKDVDLYFAVWEPLGKINLISFIAAFQARKRE
jgi:hypothetical protein